MMILKIGLLFGPPCTSLPRYKHCRLFLNTVGRVLQTLPEAEPVFGVTSLDNLLYVLRGFKSSEPIEVYDTDSYQLQQRITVPGLDDGVDIVACAHNRCAYISDQSKNCIHRVGLPNGAHVTKWPVNDKPWFLSVTDTHAVLVTCAVVRKIKSLVLTGNSNVKSNWHKTLCHRNMQSSCQMDSSLSATVAMMTQHTVCV